MEEREGLFREASGERNPVLSARRDGATRPQTWPSFNGSGVRQRKKKSFEVNGVAEAKDMRGTDTILFAKSRGFTELITSPRKSFGSAICGSCAVPDGN